MFPPRPQTRVAAFVLNRSVAMSLLTLPEETLLQITSYLRAFEIERLARTFSRRLVCFCLPLLRQRIASARNARWAIALFGDLVCDALSHAIPRTLYAAAQLETEHGPYSSPPARVNLDYLDLRGDLDGLRPLGARVEVRQSAWSEREHDSSPPMEPEGMTELLHTASRLGLHVPEAFVRFMVDGELQSRMPCTDVRSAYMPLIRMRTHDLHIDGYAVRLYVEYFSRVYCYLFLDTTGGECVITMPFVPEPILVSDVHETNEDADDVVR
jgi:hypothetical protein